MTYPKYVTPAPGDYEVQSKHNIKFTKAPTSQFGGNLCKIDRDKTGLRARALQTADDPGPNAYSVTAAKQKLDVKQRAPTFKFGSSQRADGSKIYMHRADTTGDVTDPNRAAAGRGVPGPGAYGTMGPSMEKTKKSAPRFSFGLKPAIQETTSATTINIGPGTYLSPSSIGKQVISMRPTSPGFSMGTCDREKMGEVLQPGFSPNVKNPSPGPSKYESPSGVGKQLQPAPEFVKVVDNYRTQCEYRSKHRSANSYSFGTDDKLKRQRDRGVPGPGSYDAASMLGIQSHSKFTTYGGFKFGTGQRPDTASMSSTVASLDG
jgi:hypothetical protein